MPAGRRSCRRKSGAAQAQKPQVCRQNQSARPELQNAFGPTLQKGWATRKSKLRCRLEGGAAQAQKPQVCRQNRSTRPELQNAFRPTLQKGWGTRKQKGCRLEGGAADGKAALHKRKSLRSADKKKGRPDLSYKMHSDPPFRSDPSKLPSSLRASRARRVGHPKKQIRRPPMGTSAARVADGGLGMTPDTNEHKTPGPRNDGGRPGLQRTDPQVQTT
jgi:hypothetical protein